MQWEYKTLVYQKSGNWFSGSLDVTELESVLNELGRERWELVSAAPNTNHGQQRGILLILKKQR